MQFPKHILLIVAFVAMPFMGFSQLTVDPTPLPVDLVLNTLLGGGITATNVTYTGNPAQRGYFFGSSNLGIATGVVLSTGNAVDAGGPNDNGGISTDLFGAGDGTLNSSINCVATPFADPCTRDASILEFDFIPLSDSLTFRYAFASDEYLEFANSNFNDVFGFFISGPGINGQENIALIPGTATPVSINSINSGALYTNNGDGSNPITNATVQYDGFTKVLTAYKQVTPCQTYHIKLAIADVGDGAYDSAVFLEANSFSSGTVTLSSQADYSSSINDTALFEGCGNTKIIFERTGNTTEPLTVYFNITGTATLGVDYNLSNPDSIIIPAGFNIATLDLTTIFDNIPENSGETVTITPVITVACQNQTPPSITISIADQPNLTVSCTPDFTTPCPQQQQFIATPQGGVPGYFYEWRDSTGTVLSTQPSLTVFPNRTTSYFLTVTDTCGNQTARDTVAVIIPGYVPMQFITSGSSICKGDSARVSVIASNGKSPYTYEWPINGDLNNFTYVSPSFTNSFTVIVTDLCGVVDSAKVFVNVVGPDARFTPTQTGARDFVFTNQSIGALYSYWNFGDGDTAIVFDAAHTYPDSGYYVVCLTVQNREGCYDSAKVTIRAFADLNVYIPNAFTPNNDGLNDYFYAKGEGFATSEMWILDRWGQDVYRAEHAKWAWNGQSRNGDKMEGTFCYIFEFVTPLGAKFKRTGHVTVVR